MSIVLISLLTHSGRPRVEVMDWIMGEMMSLAKADFPAMYQSLRGDSMLPHARNVIVANFLKTAATDLIMVDDDNYGETGALTQLLSHKVDVVGAACRRKLIDEEKWPVRWHADRPLKREENGLIDVESTGTGILRLSRHCVEQMVMSVKHRCYDDPTAGTAWPVFEYAINDNSWYGEDVEFCRRWRALGGTVYIDPEIRTHHIGTHDFSGMPLDYIKAQPPRIQIALPKVTVANELSNG